MLPELWKLLFKVAEEKGSDEILYSLVIFYSPALVIAAALGWVFGRWQAYAGIRKVYADVEKSRTEARLSYQELLAAVEQRQRSLDAHKWQMDQLLIDIREILRKKRKRALIDARDGLCSFYSNEYLPAFTDYLTLCQQVLPKAEMRLRAKGEFVPALETQERLISAINSKKFLDRIGGSAPYRVSRDSLDVIFARVRSGLPLWEIARRSKLKALRVRWAEHVRN